jgi:hypothetical protein
MKTSMDYILLFKDFMDLEKKQWDLSEQTTTYQTPFPNLQPY